jgi:hypothetical protein
MDTMFQKTANVKNGGNTRRGKPFGPGNPGRPRGARNKRAVLAEKIMADDLADVVRAVTAAARAGDIGAARLIFDRLLPVRRGRPVCLDTPPIGTASDVAAAMDALTTAMVKGDVTPEEASLAAGVFDLRRKALETEDFEKRLRALERMEP